MTAGQTIYTNDPVRGLAGSHKKGVPHYLATAYNAEASAAVRFGIFVKVGTPVVGPPTNGMPVKVLTATTEKPVGVTVYQRTYDRLTDLDATTGGVIINTDIGVAMIGCVLVRVEGTIVANVSRPHVRAVSGVGGTVLGAARADAVGGETIDCTNQGLFVSDDFTSFEGVKVAWMLLNIADALSVPSVGSVDNTIIAAGALSADATGRAIMSDGFFNAATVLLKFANNSIVGTSLDASIIGADQELIVAGAHAVDVTSRTTRADTTAAGNNITSTLADGTFSGQRKSLILSAASGGKTWAVSPTHFKDGTTITLDTTLDACELEWSAALTKWFVVMTTGAAVT